MAAVKKILLIVAGGIAAFKAPMVARALRRQGATVTAFCSEEALRYVTQDALEWSTAQPDWIAIAFSNKLQILRV